VAGNNYVVVGFVHPDQVSADFMKSMLALAKHSDASIVEIKGVKSGPNIARARNHIVASFLATTRASWLLFVDTDMVFQSDALARLVQAADASRRPIMGGLCFAEGDDGKPAPTMYELVGEGEAAAFATYREWPTDQPFQVAATGTGFLLLHRSVLEQVARGHNGKRDHVWPWFRESTMGRRAVGEDLTFMIRCAVAHIPVYVHTGVKIGHMKTHMLGEVA
jgi:hypothetical protein